MAGSESLAIRLRQVRKEYRLYASPRDRLKEALHPLRRKCHTLHHALKSMDLDLEPGRTLGILGRNGAGKSTLLKLIAGTLTPTFGSVETNGRIASLLELGAGFNSELTGMENIFFAGAIMGFSRREMEARVDEITAFAEIGEYIHQPVKTYSSGMFARLAFAVNTCVDPDIFIVDEALAVGDAAFVHRCMLRFHDMQQAGKTILLVTHDATMVKQLCHRALWLDKGELRMDGDADAVADAYIMDVFGQAEAPLVRGEAGGASGAAASEPKGVGGWERVIPNVDKRIGTGDYAIRGVGLYDGECRPAKALRAGGRVLVRVTFDVVNDLPEGERAVGYILHDPRGVEIASSNSRMEGADFPVLKKGDVATVEMGFVLPILSPGAYALSVSVAFFERGADSFVVLDKVLNAVCFEIVTEGEVHALMRFESEYRFFVGDGDAHR